MKHRQTWHFIRLAVMIIGLLALLSCDAQTQSQDKAEIENIIYDISRDFNWNDIPGIVAYLHPDYRHNGMQGMQFRELWLNRKTTYELLDFVIHDIAISGDYAIVSMQLSFQTSGEDLVYEEPQTSGDISYFYYDQGEWQLYGNQSLIK